VPQPTASPCAPLYDASTSQNLFFRNENSGKLQMQIMICLEHVQ